MLLLVSNDDGIDAEGLRALETLATRFGTVWTVAPATEQSAKSHAFTMTEPIRVQTDGDRRFAVSGTPADCVYLALHHILPRKPDLVLSGINRGGNLGHDVHYSGTVAAAREACFARVPAVAVSLHLTPGDSTLHYDTAAAVTRRVIEALRHSRLPDGVYLNLNVPNIPVDDLEGLRACALGGRVYAPSVVSRRDPRGGDYFWIGGAHASFEQSEGTDGVAIEKGWAALTPLTVSPTEHSTLESLRGWTDS